MDDGKLEKAKQFALQNGFSEILKRLMQERNYSIQELAKDLGIKPQSLSNKIYRNRFTFHEVQMITHLLDSKVAVFKDDIRVY